jgi:hypothetical protein
VQVKDLDTIQGTLLEMMSHIMNKRNKKAAMLLSEDFPEISLESVNFTRIISKKDLAIYCIVLSLSELNRLEIKNKVLKNPMIA